MRTLFLWIPLLLVGCGGRNDNNNAPPIEPAGSVRTAPPALVGNWASDCVTLDHNNSYKNEAGFTETTFTRVLTLYARADCQSGQEASRQTVHWELVRLGAPAENDGTAKQLDLRVKSARVTLLSDGAVRLANAGYSGYSMIKRDWIKGQETDVTGYLGYFKEGTEYFTSYRLEGDILAMPEAVGDLGTAPEKRATNFGLSTQYKKR